MKFFIKRKNWKLRTKYLVDINAVSGSKRPDVWGTGSTLSAWTPGTSARPCAGRTRPAGSGHTTTTQAGPIPAYAI